MSKWLLSKQLKHVSGSPVLRRSHSNKFLLFFFLPCISVFMNKYYFPIKRDVWGGKTCSVSHTVGTCCLLEEVWVLGQTTVWEKRKENCEKKYHNQQINCLTFQVGWVPKAVALIIFVVFCFFFSHGPQVHVWHVIMAILCPAPCLLFLPRGTHPKGSDTWPWR